MPRPLGRHIHGEPSGSAGVDPLGHAILDAFTAVLRGGTELVALVGRDACIRYVSPAFEGVLGAPTSGYLGRPVLDLVHPDDLAAMTRALTRLLGEGGALGPVDCRVVRADGGSHPVELSATDLSAVIGLDGLIVVNARDLSGRVDLEAQLAFAQTHDRVTGLGGEREFLEALDAQLASDAANVTVLAVGIDDLRRLTGGTSRDAQERILRDLGRRIVTRIDDPRRLPTSVARVGNSTFLVLCADSLTPLSIDTMAEEARDALCAALDLDGRTLNPSASVGAVEVRRAGGGGHIEPLADVIVDEAMLGLREARRLGGCISVVVDDRLRERAHRSEAMARDLRVAVEAGGLQVHYQPKVALDADRIIGFEALARWTHPTWGVVPPPVFIEIAEEHGIIEELGRWILWRSVQDAGTWLPSRTHAAPGIAVNLSARQFSAGTVREVAEALRVSGLDPGRLTLEVTESTVMDDPEQAALVLVELKALGVRLSIDDFGTGYSSLAHLRRFPLDELKIDKSFVDGLGTAQEDTAIVAAVMAMAHALHLTVVAEGVEEEAQRTELRRLGAETAQGFLFSEAVPADEAAVMAASPHAPRAARGPHPVPTGPTGADIVVADDAPEVLQLLAVSLAAAGYTTHQVPDGATALAAIRSIHPVAAVLDVEMPGLRGPEVCRLVRADPETADCTIVVLSSHASAEDRIEAYRSGADEYVVKPFSPRDIVSRTNAALERRREAVAGAIP